MDDDLEKILNDMWEKKPYPNTDYCKVKVMCMVVQELRIINKNHGVII